MKNLCFIFIAIFSIQSWATVEMKVGEQRSFKYHSGLTIVVTNPKAVKVQPQEKTINVIAKSPGVSEVKAGGIHLQILVFSAKLSELRTSLQQWVKGKYGITIETTPEKLLIKGHAYRLRDWREVQRWVRTSKLIHTEASPAPELLPALNHAVEEALHERALFSARSVMSHGRIELVSDSKNKDELRAIRELSEDWGLSLPASSDAVELRPMIEVEIVIAEIKKNAMQVLGLETPGAYAATIIPASDLSSAATTFNPITPQFNALFASGQNKVLANPKILCRSGEVAHFLAGGEIPLKIINWKTTDVTWKNYGVILDITPLADLNEGISTKLVTEISLLDESHKVDGIPGLLTNRIETHFDLRGSKTIALSGLIKSEMGRGENGIPLLGQIPILGELFKSRDYRENRTELVVFVTPRVISPENPQGVGAKDMPRDLNEFWKDDESDKI